MSINRNTVAKAYSEFESQDAIEAKVGRVCVIAANQSVASPADQHGRISETSETKVKSFSERAGAERKTADKGKFISSGTPVIQVEELARPYRTTDAVQGLNLNVQPGRCYGFFGRNGAGKTTTIKCLLDLLRPSSGTVRVLGADPSLQNTANIRLIPLRWQPYLVGKLDER